MRAAITAFVLMCLFTPSSPAAESLWLEAEHFRGIRGACFPDMNGKTDGHWAISGPGIAPEWTQGGESEWLSIACDGQDDRAAATYELELPQAANWRLWVRYRDWRGHDEVFAVRIEQPGRPPATLVFGNIQAVDDNDELKLLWKWAFGWQMNTVELVKGPARLTLLSHQKQLAHRQIDCLCLTTDESYRPRHREKPRHPTWRVLDAVRGGGLAAKPLAARTIKPGEPLPAAWKLRTFRDKGFVYLWNVGDQWLNELASDSPKRVLVPFSTDAPQLEEFKRIYGGRTDVPIFSDPRIVPAFHGPGPLILDNDYFVKWLEANPDRSWANMMNYTTPAPMTDKAKANWQRFRDRYVGNIGGESLGILQYDHQALMERVAAAKSRTEVSLAQRAIFLAGKAGTEKIIFGSDLPNPYEFAIPCLSVEMTTFAHRAREWGARTVGYENTAVAPSLAMRWAFLRGGARQYGGLTATYRSSNFGDAATIYGAQGYFYASPKFVFDNWYDCFSGAGMTWYKFDLWHQYLSGSSMFYHEQGHDEFWQPGGQAAGVKPLQLSPKGLLVDQFLQITAKHADRGTPVTPIAFLLDLDHGWDANAYQPGYFGIEPAQNPAVLSLSAHARALKEWFKVAFHPYGPKEAEVNTAVNQIFIPGVLGNVFDVIATSPTKMDIVDSYPVIILGGEISLTSEWGKKLADYMEAGGTLVVCDGQVLGPGAAALKLPAQGAPAEADAFLWAPGKIRVASQRFVYHPIAEGETLATVENDAVAAVLPRGQGKLVYLSIPKGLGIDGSATPLAALILTHARQGLLPLEVAGEVEWLLNRTESGYLVGLFNPAGASKPQHGVVPTDYAQERTAVIRVMEQCTSASEWFSDAAVPVQTSGEHTELSLVVPAGGVRIVEIKR